MQNMDNHYISLITAYTTGMVLWLLSNYLLQSVWKGASSNKFETPWLEFVFSIIAIVAILGIGQLYINDLLIPNTRSNKLVDALNQFLIFSPTLLLVFIRKHSIETIWLPKSKIPQRLAVGFVIAVISLFVYWVVRENGTPFYIQLKNTFHPKNISHLVQVFMEDITIALIFVRLSAWVGRQKTIVIVAIIFAAGHIPSMLSSGFSFPELVNLVLDTFIGVLVLSVVSKSRDVWWFFILHFALDMSQYYGAH